MPLGLLLGWLSIRNAAIALFGMTQPGIAEAFWPASGAALAADAGARVLASGGVVDRATRTLARAALVRSPASDGPLIAIAFAASGDGDLQRAPALMEAAVARNPRNATARYWLLDHAIRMGDYTAGLAQIGPALRLREGTREPVLALVAGLLALPAAAPAVRAILATDPDWRTNFIQVQASAGTDPATLAHLLMTLPASRRADANELEHRAVIYAAINHGQFALAHSLWRTTLRPPPAVTGTTIYDPDFAGLPGAPPFNWSLQSGDDGTATMVAAPRAAIALTFHGAARAILAEQYVLAPPGTYSLSLRSRADGDPVDAHLSARARCANDDSLLAQIPLGTASSIVMQAVPVLVPANCAALRIQLVGEPGDRPGTARGVVTAIRLDSR